MVKNKKGDSWAFEKVALVIISIMVFVILAYFLVKLALPEKGGDAACKLSLLGKATIPGIVGNRIPVECATKNFCIGGKCEGSFSKIDKATSVNLAGSTNEAKAEQISAQVAQEFYSCWSKTGQGKFDLFGSHEDAKPRCMICSRIVIDKNIDKSITDIVDVNDYLSKKSPDNSQTNYLQAMGLINQQKLDTEELSKNLPSEIAQASRFGTGNDRRTNEVAIVFMQVSAEGAGENTAEILGGIAGVGAVGTYGLYKINRLSGAFLPSLKNTGKTILGSAGRKFLLWGAILTGITIANSEAYSWFDRMVTASYCGTYEQGGSTGCSMVQILPYDVNGINSICQIVEGEV